MVTVPQFTMGGNIRDDWMQGTEGISNALGRYNQRQMQQRQMEQQQRQLETTNALAQGRFDMERQQFGNQQAREAEWTRLNQGSPAWAQGLPAGVADLARASGPGAAPQFINMLAQHPDVEIRRSGLQEQIAARQADTAHKARMYPLQEQEMQYKIKSLENKDPLDAAIAEAIQNGQRQAQPQVQPRPGPMLQPQSFEGGSNPALIQTQAATPQAGAQQAPDPEMVNTPLGPMTKQRADVLRLGLSRDRGSVFKEYIDESKLGKEARNDIDKKELAAVQTLARVKEIERLYKPEYVTNEGKFKHYAISWADSFDATRGKLPPDVVRDHGDFVEFRRNAVSVVNQHIKDMTGSAMGVDEAKRLMDEVANAKNDTPISFERKIKSMTRDSEMAVGRMRMLRRDGFQGQPWNGNAEQAAASLPLPQFQRMIESDTRRLYQDMRRENPQADDAQIQSAVRQSIRTKYGIDS